MFCKMNYMTKPDNLVSNLPNMINRNFHKPKRVKDYLVVDFETAKETAKFMVVIMISKAWKRGCKGEISNIIIISTKNSKLNCKMLVC